MAPSRGSSRRETVKHSLLAGIVGGIVCASITAGVATAHTGIAAVAACAPIALLGIVFATGDDDKTQRDVEDQAYLLIFSMITLVLLFSINFVLVSRDPTVRGRRRAAAVCTVVWIPVALSLVAFVGPDARFWSRRARAAG